MSIVAGRIGKYEILGEIGRGGMGTVYRARDVVLERLVALKTMSPGVLEDEEMRQRFLREARSAARLQHANIVTVYEFGEAGGAPFIAMELLEGDDLSDLMERRLLPTLDARLEIVLQLCAGLGYAHRNGVIHRDVKPTNAILSAAGTIKLVDFGIAWLEGAVGTTRSGVVMGTPTYMAPEQFTGARIDHHVDQWAVGVILYELLTERRPFTADTVPTLIYQIVHAVPCPIDPEADHVPPAVIAVVERALARDPAARFPDLDALARALRAARAEPWEQTFSVPKQRDSERTIVSVERAPVSPPVPATAVRPTPAPRPPTPRGGVADDAPFGEPRRLQTTALSPDGSLLVAGGVDGALTVWDLVARLRLATFRNRAHMRTGHGSLTTCLAFSADGALLASGHLDGAIYLWDVATGLELDTRLAHDGAVGGLCFGPGDAALISGGADAMLKVWDMEAVRAGDARRSARRQPDAITCLALAGGGRAVVTGHTNRSLRVHQLADQRLLATLHVHHSPLAALAVSATGDLVASAGRDGRVCVHHIASRERIAGHSEHGRTVAGIAFLDDGSVVSVAMDVSVIVLELGTGDLRALEAGPGACLADVRVTPDGRIVAASADGRFFTWRM